MTIVAFGALPAHPLNRLRNAASFQAWKLRQRAKRMRRALRYLTGRLTADEAQTIIVECQDVAGWYALELLCVDDVLNQARERWGEDPVLAELVADACSRVNAKWTGTGESVGAAEDWAFQLVQSYAAERGIDLVDSWDMDA